MLGTAAPDHPAQRSAALGCCAQVFSKTLLEWIHDSPTGDPPRQALAECSSPNAEGDSARSRGQRRLLPGLPSTLPPGLQGTQDEIAAAVDIAVAIALQCAVDAAGRVPGTFFDALKRAFDGVVMEPAARFLAELDATCCVRGFVRSN